MAPWLRPAQQTAPAAFVSHQSPDTNPDSDQEVVLRPPSGHFLLLHSAPLHSLNSPHEVLMASLSSAYFHLLSSYFLAPAAALVA